MLGLIAVSFWLAKKLRNELAIRAEVLHGSGQKMPKEVMEIAKEIEKCEIVSHTGLIKQFKENPE